MIIRTKTEKWDEIYKERYKEDEKVGYHYTGLDMQTLLASIIYATGGTESFCLKVVHYDVSRIVTLSLIISTSNILVIFL